MNTPVATKRFPPVTIEVLRLDYTMTFKLRHRRTFAKMSPAERATVLTAGATALEEYAQQMRVEAQEIAAS